jgi:hypothetical protein
LNGFIPFYSVPQDQTDDKPVIEFSSCEGENYIQMDVAEQQRVHVTKGI